MKALCAIKIHVWTRWVKFYGAPDEKSGMRTGGLYRRCGRCGLIQWKWLPICIPAKKEKT